MSFTDLREAANRLALETPQGLTTSLALHLIEEARHGRVVMLVDRMLEFNGL